MMGLAWQSQFEPLGLDIGWAPPVCPMGTICYYWCVDGSQVLTPPDNAQVAQRTSKLECFSRSVLHSYIYTFYIYIYVDMAAPQKHRACKRPGRTFCDKTCNRIGVSCDNPPPCDKPVEDYSTLNRPPATRVCNRGRVTKVWNRGATATNPYFEALPYRYRYRYTYVCIYIYMYSLEQDWSRRCW